MRCMSRDLAVCPGYFLPAFPCLIDDTIVHLLGQALISIGFQLWAFDLHVLQQNLRGVALI